jgi:circadian clock protein KaiC
VVVLDPIDAFVIGANQTEVKIMLLRLVDFLKMNNITAFFASLNNGGENRN